MNSVIFVVLLIPLITFIIIRALFGSDTKEVAPSPPVDLTSYTVKELRSIAKLRGVKGISQLKKVDLIKRLQQ